MKNNLLLLLWGRSGYRIIFVSVIIGVLIANEREGFSQEEKDSVSLLPVTMNLSYKVSDGIRSVKVKVTRKEKRKTIAVDNLKSPVNLYLSEVKKHDPADGTGWIGNLFLDEKGEGIFELSANFTNLISGFHEYTFIAKSESDPVYEDAEESVTVTDAKIIMEYSGDDSIKTATGILSGWKDSAYVPVPDAELKLFIKRTFNPLLIGETGRVTDENGKLSAGLPLDIPGNHNGTITIGAKIDDHENFGTVEVTKDVPWSVPPKESPAIERTLWSSGANAPLPLVISSVVIIVVIWGTIFYLIFLLFKIRRISKKIRPGIDDQIRNTLK
ncbi:MAG: hypothetical protein HYY40_08395 [Bacteroidetes bacterium]|nr:hypothetical protein [Bacteroidota bacterium]